LKGFIFVRGEEERSKRERGKWFGDGKEIGGMMIYKKMSFISNYSKVCLFLFLLLGANWRDDFWMRLWGRR